MRTIGRIVDLPALYRDRDVAVETRLDRESGLVRHVVQIAGGASSRDTALAMATARRKLEGVPETLVDVEVQLSPASAEALLRAEEKRKRKAGREQRSRERREQRAQQQQTEVHAMARAAGLAER